MSQSISSFPSAVKSNSNSVYSTASTKPLVTIGPCLDQAKQMVRQVNAHCDKRRNRQYQKIFIALADGDTATGLLAYYLWRRRARRWR